MICKFYSKLFFFLSNSLSEYMQTNINTSNSTHLSLNLIFVTAEPNTHAYVIFKHEHQNIKRGTYLPSRRASFNQLSNSKAQGETPARGLSVPKL